MISIIAAMTKDRVIGKDNQLPWHIPEDLKLFRKVTQGCTVIMGRNTFESIGRPLPNRHNIILSSPDLDVPGIDVCQSNEQALELAQSYGKKIFIIGGAYTYAQFLPITDYLYLSYIKQNYSGDVFFPVLDLSQWEIIERIDYPEFEFVLYKKFKKN